VVGGLPVILSWEDLPQGIKLFISDFLNVYHNPIYHDLISVNSLDVVAGREGTAASPLAAANGLLLGTSLLDPNGLGGSTLFERLLGPVLISSLESSYLHLIR